MRSANQVKSSSSRTSKLLHVGWREWVCLPEFSTTPIKVKIDTGARSSALHAFNIRPFQRENQNWLRFDIHPVQHRKAGTVTVEAKQVDQRSVRSSNGRREIRPVITTPVCIGQQQWSIEITLTNRDEMGFRMLLGRQALRKRFLINPGKSYLQDQPQPSTLNS